MVDGGTRNIFLELPLSGTTTEQTQLILSIGLVAMEGQQNTVLYQSIDIKPCNRMWDVDQP